MMQSAENKLRYADESDRCYGLAGMALTLLIDEDDDALFDSISIDLPLGEAVKLLPRFIHTGRPDVSARLAYASMVREHKMLCHLLLGNIMSRYYTKRRAAVPEEVKKQLQTILYAEAADSCQLGDDEAEAMFANEYNYLYRVFNHAGVQQATRDFVNVLAERRTLSRHEVIDLYRIVTG